MKKKMFLFPHLHFLHTLLQTAFETALRATSSPLIRKHLLAAKERPIPTNSAGLPMDADAKDMGYIGVALQVYPLCDSVELEKL